MSNTRRQPIFLSILAAAACLGVFVNGAPILSEVQQSGQHRQLSSFQGLGSESSHQQEWKRSLEQWEPLKEKSIGQDQRFMNFDGHDAQGVMYEQRQPQGAMNIKYEQGQLPRDNFWGSPLPKQDMTQVTSPGQKWEPRSLGSSHMESGTLPLSQHWEHLPIQQRDLEGLPRFDTGFSSEKPLDTYREASFENQGPTYKPISFEKHTPMNGQVSFENQGPTYKPISFENQGPTYKPISFEKQTPINGQVSFENQRPTYKPISFEKQTPLNGQSFESQRPTYEPISFEKQIPIDTHLSMEKQTTISHPKRDSSPIYTPASFKSGELKGAQLQDSTIRGATWNSESVPCVGQCGTTL
ncbi:hypothetical protein G9A89_011519 [Geosiphon pyriformis]|nr:hypothetical protein G9A89_011519 [Geosiphon pyriformis]